jgi:hypothetical protein
VINIRSEQLNDFGQYVKCGFCVNILIIVATGYRFLMEYRNCEKRPKTRNLSLLSTRKLGIKNFIFIPKHRFALETFSYKYRDEMKIIPVLDNQVPKVVLSSTR